MNKNINNTILKKSIRKILLQKRREFSKNEKNIQNKKIASLLENTDAFQKAKVIFTYISLPDEVDTEKLIKKYLKSKIIVVPKTKRREKKIEAHKLNTWKELQQKAYGILEPKAKKTWPWKKIDLALIPGVAFDRQGNRIGYGKGYYDGILHKLSCPKIGLGYHFQVLSKLFAENHDIPVDIIITDREIINCKEIQNTKLIEKNTIGASEKRNESPIL
ncbi:5-formyltetrahydrofolate cyclo-ligase [Candidatus Peregrinibacteria bacterium]|nr:5-formyltetrahydrofolate cyclo-ligase [Candidatus Peregrinibacteria bacterium]